MFGTLFVQFGLGKYRVDMLTPSVEYSLYCCLNIRVVSNAGYYLPKPGLDKVSP